MKRTTLLYSTILSLGLLMGACAEDDGNYDYTPINSVTIEGLEEDLLVEAGSRLQLTPVLNITDESSINLSYEWTIGETVVSNERNLDIALPPLDYGEHLCALTIRDLDNGMQYRMTFSLTRKMSCMLPVWVSTPSARNPHRFTAATPTSTALPAGR